MGGWQSSPQPAAQATTAKGGLTASNNNRDVVVIPVDASKQAESAFLCMYPHGHVPVSKLICN